MPSLPNQDLEDRLSAAGKHLIQLSSSSDGLLTLLDGIEELLSAVGQSPPTSMKSAISSLSKALISEDLLKHSDTDVQVGVAACISEITRITAPEAPYDDDEMKDVFQLIVSSFANLSDTSSRSYKKRVIILETLSKVRSCVIMLDLELDEMIIEMFQHFLKSIRFHHQDIIFSSMNTIMTLVLEESEDITSDMLCPILDALKKDNKDVLPIAKQLAARVIESVADKLRPCLANAVHTLNASLDDYDEVVASVCQKTNGNIGNSDENILSDQSTAKDVDEKIKPQEKDPVPNGSHKSIACNSFKETGEEITVTDDLTLEKAKFKQQFDSQSTTKSESEDMGTQRPVHLEVKPDHVADGETRLADCRNNSVESSDILDDNKQGEQVPCNKETSSEEIHTLPDEFLPVDAEKPLDETVKDSTIHVSPVKETEVEAENVASPIQQPDDSRPKRAGQNKRKKSMVKEDTASKASEGPNIGDANKKRRMIKKQHNLTNSVDKTLNEGVSRNDAGAMSDSEARELGSSVNKKENRSSLKEDGKRGGHVKQKTEEETSINSAVDDGKDKNAALSPTKSEEAEVSQEEITPMVLTTKKRASGKDKEKIVALSPTKSEEDEVSQEENPPMVLTTKKRASGKDKTPQTLKYGKNLIGSKVKVFWPDDKEFYEGVIDSYDYLKKRHKVIYDDGEEEDLNLRKEEWEFVTGDSVIDGGKSAEPSSQVTSSKKKKTKGTSSKTSNKNEKMDDTPKRKLKGCATKPGSKSKDDGKAKVESPVKSEEATDKSEDQSDEHEIKSPDSSTKISGKSRSSNKKQSIQRPTNSKGKASQSKKILGPVGKGMKKSSSSKGKETVEVEKKLDSVKSTDAAKGGMSRESGKKRRK